MSFAVCNVAVAPIRKESSDASEMTTQLLFGELCTVLDTHKQWKCISIYNDKYEGWIDEKQLTAISEEVFHELETQDYYIKEPHELLIQNGLPLPITFGAELRGLQNTQFNWGNDQYQFNGMVLKEKISKQEMLSLSSVFLNVPYLWGGKSTYGIDCSGFVQILYKLAGVKLPRDAYMQAEMGEVLSFIEEAEPGDVAFFENEDGKIIHVGIILENSTIIHAHGKVRIDMIDSNGIFNKEYNKYTHTLRFIRKLI